MVAEDLLRVAEEYLAGGLSVLPALRIEKRPAVKGRWEPFKKRLPGKAEISAWFANAQDALCLVCGAVSGNLEVIDFDCAGEFFEPWRATVGTAAQGLLDRLVIESTPSGGQHIAYRCETQVSGNLKLAQRRRPVADHEIHLRDNGSEVVELYGKEYIVRTDADGNKYVLLTLIETRGEGGIVLCAPTAGYELAQGDIAALPVLTAEERDVLLETAWGLNEYWPEPANPTPSAPHDGGLRPGDDFNERGCVRAVLVKHGWLLAGGTENEYWRRPGKDKGWSATLKNGVFYVFSSNAEPFEPNRAYSPFAVYAQLECGGDFELAARVLRQQGYGGDSPVESASDVDLSALLAKATPRQEELPKTPEDPGPLPDEILDVPGFIREVRDYTLATAPYPQTVLAFAAALTLQAFLAGRKVRDSADNRTNIYVLALANSGAGKDHPRKVNQRICVEAGLADCLGDGFASGEGIEDRMFVKPSLLFQTDEIDGLMNAINRASDARHESIMNVLLKMYTSSNAIYPMRVKAGKQSPGLIDQPSLCVLGTAVPKYYYEALSIRMLNNGFFARLLILEAGKRGRGQTPPAKPVPQSIVETARWWADLKPLGNAANLQSIHPQPGLVGSTPAADAALEECLNFADDRYAEAEGADDPAAMAIWARAYEKTRKLALIYAVSENHESPRIDFPAVEWASRFVMHQTRRMLFMAQAHVAENPFHAECLKLMKKLREAPDRTLAHSVLLKRMKMNAKVFHELVETLAQRGDVEVIQVATPGAGRPGILYRLCGDSQG